MRHRTAAGTATETKHEAHALHWTGQSWRGGAGAQAGGRALGPLRGAAWRSGLCRIAGCRAGGAGLQRQAGRSPAGRQAAPRSLLLLLLVQELLRVVGGLHQATQAVALLRRAGRGVWGVGRV